MPKQLRHKGQFIKKKKLAKKLSFVSEMKKAKERKSELKEKNTNKDPNPNLEGRRIVEYSELGKNLKCYKCKQVLCLENIEIEKLLGLNSKLWVRCENCSCVTQVMAGKVHDGDKNSKLSDVNSKVVLGALHAGVGHTALNKILACLNIPQISDTLFKRYEREVRPAIEKAVAESCKNAAQEERQLITENIDKLCDELPKEIVDEIYPHLTTLRSNNPLERNLVPDNSNQRTYSKVFDSSIGEIINIIVSYDMGWSKRGNGRSYDSLNGYGCIIGFLSNKILDYATRNRKCKLCSNGHPKTDHDCRENFRGSAKAMEPNVGAASVNGSTILKSVGLNVRVVGDEDSSTIASIRRGAADKIFKLSDKNHLQKSFKRDLYQLKPKFKELARKNTIPHSKKCFNYAISQNKNLSSKLASVLKSIPDHFFNQHENCEDWCKRGVFNDTSSQKVILKDPQLYTHLYNIFSKYADNAHRIAFAASTQANESVNNIMAHKAPKSHCYSMSESSDYRYASAVCSKNDGESHLLDVHKILLLSPGKNTALYASRQEMKRQERAKRAKLLSAKARRNLLAENREKLRKKNEKTEGVQYESNCGLTNNDDSNQVIDIHIASMSQNNLPISPDNCGIVYFDLETSGFGKCHEILQIAAMCKGHEFTVYVNPTKEISSEAPLHTGLRNIAGQLYFRDKKLETLPLKDALLSFLQFLNLSSRPCVLVAHNSSFDSSFFIRAILQCKMVLDFKKIAGFCGSLSLFKKVLSTRKGEGLFKLGALAKDILKIESTENFHEALYDVQILKQLTSSILNTDDIFKNTKSWTSLLTHTRQLEKSRIMLPYLKPLKTVLKDGTLKKMAIEGITYDLVKKTFDDMGDSGLVELMSSKMSNGKPRVTKNKRIINQIINIFKPNIK